jgi:sugar phosphate isomerase/epimerase
MPKPLSIQLYTVRELMKKDPFGVISEIARMGYAGIEIGGDYYGKTATEFRRFADDLGLKVSGAHVGLLDPEKRQKIVDDAGALGYTKIITGFWVNDFASREALQKSADRINEAINYYKPRGLTVAYHNHEHEFLGPVKDVLIYDLMPECEIQLDIYWASLAGVNPVDFTRRYARRVSLLHVKDGPADLQNRNAPMVAVGSGRVNIPEAIRAAEYHALEWNIVELDHCATDMMQAVRDSYDYLTRRGLAEGKR